MEELGWALHGCWVVWGESIAGQTNGGGFSRRINLRRPHLPLVWVVLTIYAHVLVLEFLVNLVPSPKHRRLFAFSSLVVLQWIIAFGAAQTVRNVATCDTAYYYVIARNFARGRGLTDNVLWQFLHAPATVEQPAGSYWEVGWPLFLGSILRVFGDSQRVAIMTCVVLSGLLPLLTALIAHQLSKRLDIAWVAGVLVCLQSRLWATDVTPDSTLPYQLTCLLGLAAFQHAYERALSPTRLIAVGMALSLPMYVRGEGFILLLATLPCLLATPLRSLRENVRRTFCVVLGIGLLAAPFVIRNFVVFGETLPQGRSLRLWMTRYDELSAFHAHPSLVTWWAQGIEKLASLRWTALEGHLEVLTYQIPWPLVLLATIGVVLHIVRIRGRRPPAIPLFFVFTWLVPCLVVPLIANADRFVMNTVPLLCVCASGAIFALLDFVKILVDKRIGWVLVAMAIWSCTTLFRSPGKNSAYLAALHIYREERAYLNAGALGALHLQRDDVVVTDDPWRVTAELDVATIMAPLNGDAAVEALVMEYRPRFVLVTSSPALQRLAWRKRIPMHRVATFRGGAWYEVDGPIKSATGPIRQTPR